MNLPTPRRRQSAASPLSLVILLLLSPLASAASITFTNAVTISEADTSLDGQDLIISNATVTINGAHRFNSLLLTNNAVLTHSP